MRRGGGVLPRPPLARSVARAGPDSDDRIERTGAEQAGGQRHDADQVKPAILARRVETEGDQQGDAHKDTKGAVDAADVFLEHDVLFHMRSSSRKTYVHKYEYDIDQNATGCCRGGRARASRRQL